MKLEGWSEILEFVDYSDNAVISANWLLVRNVVLHVSQSQLLFLINLIILS